MEVHHNPLYAGVFLYPSFPPLGRLTSLSVAGDLALCGCLLELDSRDKVKNCRVGVTNNISKCLVERFAVVIGTVEVRLYSISLVPGFRWEAGSPSTQSNYPSFPPLGRLTSLSVAGDLAICGCLLELDSREKVKDCRVGVTNNISKCLVERFAVVIGTVEVRLYSISLVPGFRLEAGSPSTQSNDPSVHSVQRSMSSRSSQEEGPYPGSPECYQ